MSVGVAADARVRTPDHPRESLHSTIASWFAPGGLSARTTRVVRVTLNLVGAAGAALFALATVRYFLRTHALIGAAFVIEQTWIVVAYLVRRPARSVSRRLDDWLLAFAGTFGGVLFRPTTAHPHWGAVAGLVVQIVGLVLCVWALRALGRSFGFAAADRGLVRRGPYAVVRHPVYASYFLLQLGYVLQSPSVRNGVVLGFVTACNVGRALVEERHLAAQSSYAPYRQLVRRRLIPGVW